MLRTLNGITGHAAAYSEEGPQHAPTCSARMPNSNTLTPPLPPLALPPLRRPTLSVMWKSCGARLLGGAKSTRRLATLALDRMDTRSSSESLARNSCRRGGLPVILRYYT